MSTIDVMAPATVHHEIVMGTVVSFDIRAPAAPEATVRAAIEAAVSWLHYVDQTFSTYRPDSEVNRFDRGELVARDCSADLRHVIGLCHRFERVTEGFFDAWAGGRFDPSGVVKGWSIERASEILTRMGLTDHLVDGGGDLRLRGRPAPGQAWQVGIRHPLAKNAFSAAVCLGEGAVATSGTYERGSHILDPRSGKPANELASVTVVGPDLTTADAYATAAFVMGADAPGWLEALSGYEAMLVTPQGRGWWTPGFKDLEISTVTS